MRIACIFLLLVGAGLYSCQWGVPHSKKPAITKDTLKYTYKALKELAPDCGNKADSSCTVVTINYLEFPGQNALNDTIVWHSMASFQFKEKLDDTSLHQFAQSFIKAYEDEKKNDPRGSLIYSLDIRDSVLRQDSSLLSLQFSAYGFTGGAHGGSSVGFVNWNTKSGRKITLKDIVKDGTYDKLTTIAEKIFRKDEKLSDTESLADNYFFKDGKFHLNDNFLITPTGLRFLYNEYEIKSYAAGRTNLVIPYAQIKDLLQPNTVIRQYIK